MVEKVIHNSAIHAIIVRADFCQDGIVFFTPDEFSQQLGYMNRPSGYVIPPHVHNLVTRAVQYTSETLFIRVGVVRVDFYDDDRVYLESRVLRAGDVILLSGGGHGLKVLERAEIVEVKQGPYLSDLDKIRFIGIDEAHIEIKDESK